MPSLRGEKQNALFTQEQIESDGEERKKKKKYFFQGRVTRYSLEITVLGPGYETAGIFESISWIGADCTLTSP